MEVLPGNTGSEIVENGKIDSGVTTTDFHYHILCHSVLSALTKPISTRLQRGSSNCYYHFESYFFWKGYGHGVPSAVVEKFMFMMV